LCVAAPDDPPPVPAASDNTDEKPSKKQNSLASMFGWKKPNPAAPAPAPAPAPSAMDEGEEMRAADQRRVHVRIGYHDDNHAGK